MNKIMIMGRLGKDPELKYTPSGKAVCKVSVAVDEKYGEKKTTTWFDVDFWEKTAETVAKHFKKGDSIIVEGRVSSRQHEGKTYWTVIGERFFFCGGNTKAEGKPDSKAPARQEPDSEPPVGDDEIPF